MSVWIGMTGGMDKHWGEKELPRIGHQLASCSLLSCYVVMVLVVAPRGLCTTDTTDNMIAAAG